VTSLREAVAELYRQVQAPEWAAANLDALADVLRDLSWLPAEPVAVSVPAGMAAADAQRLRAVLAAVEHETAHRERSVRVTAGS
jgi:hypothetical protein